jgi:predicted ATPase
MNSPIQKFEIKGLLGEKDVLLEFESEISIFIADNGSGKTTILSIIYAVLSRKLNRLRRFTFDLIAVTFENGKVIEIPSSLVQPLLDLSRSDPRARSLMNQVPEGTLQQLMIETAGSSYFQFRGHPLVADISEMIGTPPRYLYETLHARSKQEQLTFSVGTGDPEEIRKSLDDNFPFALLYFPTYRRIEEELEHLGYERKEDVRTDGLIQFGMTDVNARIKKITEEIRSSSVNWYSRINGQMLSQLVDGIKVDEEARRSIRDQGALKIVLDRIGSNIDAAHKKHIMQLVETGGIEHEKYEALVYFLSNLIKIYDQQKDLDNSIKAFTRVCNKYLGEKEVLYDESAVSIGIVQKWNGKAVDLSKLSSGEKQIISLFSKIYLEPAVPLALLFDEPELSLSIEWQRMLLPDIVASGRCKFLVATTHSPFVFDNQFDTHTTDLNRFIRRIKV